MTADGAGPGDAPQRVPALIVTHADLAQGLVHAAERVVGPIEDVTLLSNEGLSREALEGRIAETVRDWSSGGLVLTDFWGDLIGPSIVAVLAASLRDAPPR